LPLLDEEAFQNAPLKNFLPAIQMVTRNMNTTNRNTRAFSVHNSSQNIGRRLRPFRFADVQTLFVVALLSTFFLSPNKLSAAPVLPLHTSGASIVDTNGAPVRLNAFSWYGAESKDFVVAGLETADLTSTVQAIKGLGFNTVRLPWSNEMLESNPVVDSSKLTANPGLQGQNALSVFDTVIGALTNAGIMVVLDNHNSNAEWCCGDDGNTLWYNSAYPESNWLSDWEAMTARYQGNPMVIGADLRNEPRVNATWGGNASTDWRAAAQRGGNAVLAVNPNLLIFVEGVNYSLDFSGAANNPVQLNVSGRLVYSPHDYSYDYNNVSSYNDYANQINSRWGYLVTSSNPQPVWMSEFGTCNTSPSCVASTSSRDNGLWFNYLTTYLQQHSIGWSYWAINGTQSTGSGRTYGAAESYGVLNTLWNGSASTALTGRLGTMISASPGFSLFSAGSMQIASAGHSGTTTVAIVPLNGFTGTINLSCAVSNSTASVDLPACTLPPTVSITSADATSVTVNLATTATNGKQGTPLMRRAGGAVIMALIFGFLLVPRLRHRAFYVLLLPSVLLLTGMGGCDSGSNGSAGTSVGTYAVTVSATSGTTSSNVQFNALVQ
jgi:endoglucanase